MRKFLVIFLWVSVSLFLLVAFGGADDVMNFLDFKSKKFVHIDLSKGETSISHSEIPVPNEYQDWRVAYAHYYDPSDPNQTKEKPDTIGASMRKIESGSMAMDSAFIADIANNYRDRIVYIQIKGSKIKTKYCRNGEYGVFRVDDTKHPRYVGDYVEFIRSDFFQDRNNLCYIKDGKYYSEFRILRIEKKTNS